MFWHIFEQKQLFNGIGELEATGDPLRSGQDSKSNFSMILKAT